MTLAALAERLTIDDLDALHALHEKYKTLSHTHHTSKGVPTLKESCNPLGLWYIGHLYADARRYDALFQNPDAVSYCYMQFHRTQNDEQANIWKLLYDFCVSHHIAIHTSNAQQKGRKFYFVPTRKEHMLWCRLKSDAYYPYATFFDGLSKDFVRDIDERVILDSAFWMLKCNVWNRENAINAIVYGLTQWLSFNYEDQPKSVFQTLVTLSGPVTKDNVLELLREAKKTPNEIVTLEEIELHVET